MAVYVVGGCRRGSTSLWAYSRRVAKVEKKSGEENGASPIRMNEVVIELANAWSREERGWRRGGYCCILRDAEIE
jgi:hypothetical protein